MTGYIVVRKDHGRRSWVATGSVFTDRDVAERERDLYEDRNEQPIEARHRRPRAMTYAVATVTIKDAS